MTKASETTKLGKKLKPIERRVRTGYSYGDACLIANQIPYTEQWISKNIAIEALLPHSDMPQWAVACIVNAVCDLPAELRDIRVRYVHEAISEFITRLSTFEGQPEFTLCVDNSSSASEGECFVPWDQFDAVSKAAHLTGDFTGMMITIGRQLHGDHAGKGGVVYSYKTTKDGFVATNIQVREPSATTAEAA